MRKINYFTAAFVCLALVTSCKKEDNSHDNSGSSNSPSITSIITSGSWSVSYHHVGSDDHTTDFSGYTFTFSTGGTMTAVHSGDITNGTWSRDDSHNEIHFSIGSSSPLSDLSSGWSVVSSTSSKMVFRDDGNSSEELHFIKI
jgi:hypothetical protein